MAGLGRTYRLCAICLLFGIFHVHAVSANPASPPEVILLGGGANDAVPAIAAPCCNGEAGGIGSRRCLEGKCPVYYRQRAEGSKTERRLTILENRASEPGWYRYYRCEHYGYYPTTWDPWPEGWDQCRYPKEGQPSPHPYDRKRLPSKDSAKPPANSTDRPSLTPLPDGSR